jgi:HlyD family secretion protein
MDRDIPIAVRRKRLLGRIAVAILLVTCAGAALTWAPGLLEPGIRRDRVRTAKVQSGPIESTVSASGLAEPEIEHVISSPADSRIVRLLKHAGAAVHRGEAILELDTNQLRLALERLEQQIGLKLNELEKARLDLENTLLILRNQVDVKTLELDSARSFTARSHALFRENLVARDHLDQAVLSEKKTQSELKDLQERIRHAEKATQVQYAGLEMSMNILQKERDEARRELELATTTSDRDGVLTWVVPEEGASVRRGDVLARIADLSSFRVKASVSDVHASRLREGLQVIVRVGEAALEGRIRQVLPTITNGIISVVVQLDAPSHPLLKSNLRVDAEIVLNRKSRVLRIGRGPGVEPEGPRRLFVVRGDRAVRTPVELGAASYEYCEVVSGLVEGDEIIITDMKEYQNVAEIRLRE